MLDLDEVREQLRIEAEDTSDTLLERYVGAAVRRFQARTLRQLYRTAEDVPDPAPANALVLEDDVVLALLLLVGHWDKNREAATDLRLAPVPQGFEELAAPYRWWPD
ncbi:head-tail connector protein [Achromobacter denitrificans]|uniref:head-tail connector protein n=1 Tax=Achromobacter denitrificans TaxID=32002 RepID=UPI0023E786EC|nr:head-tail connector protein [Achromobacter denitrificans]MDF3850680.1 head-tail connector protein [Achromobacter denitrificans]